MNIKRIIGAFLGMLLLVTAVNDIVTEKTSGFGKAGHIREDILKIDSPIHYWSYITFLLIIGVFILWIVFKKIEIK